MEIRNEASSSYRTAAPAVPVRVPGRCTVVLGNASRTFYHSLQELVRSFLKFDWSTDSRFNMSIHHKVHSTRMYDKRDASLFRRGSLHEEQPMQSSLLKEFYSLSLVRSSS